MRNGICQYGDHSIADTGCLRYNRWVVSDPALPPVKCPLCHALAVKPFKRAHHDPASPRILFRCESCGHRWSEIEPLLPHPGQAGRGTIS